VFARSVTRLTGEVTVTDHYAPPRPLAHARRSPLWLGARGGIVAAALVALGACGTSSTPPRHSAASGERPGYGPSACVVKGAPATGSSGPWKVVQPTTLCGLPADNSPQSASADQEALSGTELVFDPVDQANPGHETSAFSVSYQIPSGANFERFVNVVAFNGTFNTQAAVSELAQLDTNPDIPGNVFKSVPPGPHGGLMECSPVVNNEECVFGTPTTLGQFTIADTLNELTGANTPANAIRIRDALEVQG
jgi:hypothetical protein